ncbi:MAG: hypothetical protein Q9195_002467 [Heterodermia aff. obscurata]
MELPVADLNDTNQYQEDDSREGNPAKGLDGRAVEGSGDTPAKRSGDLLAAAAYETGFEVPGHGVNVAYTTQMQIQHDPAMHNPWQS